MAYAWVLDRKQTFDTDVRATWADQFNDGGSIALTDKSYAGAMGIVSTGYNASMRPKGATYLADLRIEMDVVINSVSQFFGMVFWPLSGSKTIFYIHQFNAIVGTDVPTGLYRAENVAPQFAAPDITTQNASFSLPIEGVVRTYAFEVFDNPAISGKTYRAYVDGTLVFSWDDAVYPIYEKFIGGIFVRNIDIDIREYREYHREVSADPLEVETLISGSPEVPTTATVKAFDAASDIVVETVVTDPVTGKATFVNLLPAKSYYFIARLPDDSYGIEGFGPVDIP